MTSVAATWSGDATETRLGPHVEVVAQGHGEVVGDARDMDLRWTSGTLAVEVAPGQGVGLRVETEEGVVVVHGTAFEVVRDALGTHVGVRRGEVEVVCGHDDPVFLGPDDQALTGSVPLTVPWQTHKVPELSRRRRFAASASRQRWSSTTATTTTAASSIAFAR